MKKTVIKIEDLSQLQEAAQCVLSLVEHAKILAFYGEMGVGKTTFIKALCQQLGSLDNVNSPTFSIVNEYITSDSQHIYHFDFYRIKNVNEALNIGVEEYFYSGDFCFLEWPEKIETLLPENLVAVTIEKDHNNESRTITLESKMR